MFMAAYQSASGLLPVSGLDLQFGKAAVDGYAITQKSIFKTTIYHTSHSDLEKLASNFRITGWRYEGGFTTCGLGELNTENEDLGHNRPHLPWFKIEHTENKSAYDFIDRMLGKTPITDANPVLSEIDEHFVGRLVRPRFEFCGRNPTDSNIELLERFRERDNRLEISRHDSVLQIPMVLEVA